jgi:uncharacterized protein YllA (UPF0747 family)
MVQDEPCRLTASALLRPLLQDAIFPNAATITGPAEFRYHASIRPLYDFFNLRQPCILPRSSFLLLEQKEAKTLQELKLDPSHLSANPSLMFQELLAGSEESPAGIFEELPYKVQNLLHELSNSSPLFEDPLLIRAKIKTERAILRNLEKLRRQCTKAQEREQATLFARLERLAWRSFPEGNTQERLISWLPYQIRHGEKFFTELLRATREQALGQTSLLALSEDGSLSTLYADISLA